VWRRSSHARRKGTSGIIPLTKSEYRLWNGLERVEHPLENPNIVPKSLLGVVLSHEFQTSLFRPSPKSPLLSKKQRQHWRRKRNHGKGLDSDLSAKINQPSFSGLPKSA
jgi:hypothetical protein